MQINGLTIDFTAGRASINFVENYDKYMEGASGLVQVPIKTQAGETIDEAKRHSRLRAADALGLVVNTLRKVETAGKYLSR